MEWRLLLHVDSMDPHLNLAVEEALNKLCTQQVTLRLWANKESVIVGQFLDLLEEVDLEYCIQNEIPIVRRHTGGGAVFQDPGNLNITLIIPRAGALSASEGYRILMRGIAIGLREFGIRAYETPPNIVTVGGKKISGMAAAMTKGSLLTHSTLLVDSNIEKMMYSLRSMKFQVTTLSREVKFRGPSIYETCKALIDAFEEIQRTILVDGELTREEERLSDELLDAKYSRDSWNFRTRKLQPR